MRLLVIEERGAGQAKIQGIRRYGPPGLELKVVNVEVSLPDFIEEPEEYLPDHLDADLVISYLRHPDLCQHLVTLCRRQDIPLVASGRKSPHAHTPFTCCGLGRHPSLGLYGRFFGFPEYRIRCEDGVVTGLEVIRGAPCGATWAVIPEVIGKPVTEILVLLPRLVQYHCSSDPSRFDPVSGKSPVHYAGHVHRTALEKALREAGQEPGSRTS